MFTIVFAVEMLLKVIGLGATGYLRDGMNIFDCTLVIISFINLAFNVQASDDQAQGQKNNPVNKIHMKFDRKST